MAMAVHQKRKIRPPLTTETLQEAALSYVGRFATSRSKLLSYLQRKVRERGWEGSSEPPLDQLAKELEELGYIDDRAYALSKARTLTNRGYGERRVRQALAFAGIDEENGADARDLAKEEAVAAAIRFAKRRGLGPFAARQADLTEQERGLAAMIRAGHHFALAKAIINLKPGENPDFESLSNLR